uniref:PI3K regulatory subunit p85-related inter-SH2 domain-containing protein n=1 Tax=Amphimedon queenslandica TaxID=400682 RepID=A0A1X7SY33_AMPQE
MFRDGYFGFAEPLEFRSVVELPYSSKLDITLKEPVSKTDIYEQGRDKSESVSLDEIVRQLKATEKDLREKGNRYNELTNKYEKITQEIQIMRLDLLAQEQILMMLKEHLDTSNRLQAENKSPDVKQHDILAEASVKEDNPDDDLYATYAMLHTHRTDDDDYRRISEEIQKKKKKPPPPPPQSNVSQDIISILLVYSFLQPLFVSLPPTEATLSRSPHRPLPPHPSLSIENAQPMMPPLQFNEAD